MSALPDSPAASVEEAPDWILEVEGLGPIQHARVEPAPLTLLVGDNNSGKSYLATLLWGLQAGLRDVLTDPRASQLPSFQPCLQLLRELQPDSTSQGLGEQGLRDLTAWVAEAITEYGIGHLLNRPDYRPRRFDLRRTSYLNRAVLRLFSDERVQKNILMALLSSDSFASVFLDADEKRRAFMYRVFAMYLGGLRLALSYHSEFPSFLPASRTGFMLLRSQAAQTAMQVAFGSESQAKRSNIRLSLPMLQLMERLAEGLSAPQPGPFAEEARRLEATLGGELLYREREVGLPEYLYRPMGTEQELAMHASSSMVTELAPILLTLRYAPTLPFLVIEEPEAHLHPKVQRALARTLVRLVRKGVRLVITTHSDLFCQQINNCIKLGERPEDERRALQERLGYSEDEYLRADDVRGYGFSNLPDGSGSKVSELARSPYGLVMPTFNVELDRLLAETAELDRAIPFAAADMEPAR